ncbi:uncharacterized protein LOC106011339 [Aplysia californica]|uniref:Uncharacterized protein LOC106011339 n=1 Tax=Aplysia californica TaxID=6500 RepID=A0ABM0ZWM5_APLCA|nr:uncharacterized protein LOC106011339 [Aplysia californica]
MYKCNATYGTDEKIERLKIHTSSVTNLLIHLLLCPPLTEVKGLINDTGSPAPTLHLSPTSSASAPSTSSASELSTTSQTRRHRLKEIFSIIFKLGEEKVDLYLKKYDTGYDLKIDPDYNVWSNLTDTIEQLAPPLPQPSARALEHQIPSKQMTIDKVLTLLPCLKNKTIKRPQPPVPLSISRNDQKAMILTKKRKAEEEQQKEERKKQREQRKMERLGQAEDKKERQKEKRQRRRKRRILRRGEFRRK